MGTYSGGLNLLDGAANKFTHFKNGNKAPSLLSNNYIPYIEQLDSNHFLIAHGELEILNTANKSTEKIKLPKNTWSNGSAFKTSEIFGCFKVFIDHAKKWWLTGESGLVRYDPVARKFGLFCLQKNIPGNFRFASTWDCTEDAKQNIWIGSARGLFEYSYSTRKFEEHYPVKFLATDIKSNWVRCVLCDNDGSVWFGTDNGLFHFFPEMGKYFVYRNDPHNSSSISDNNINCLYKDKQNILWVGTSNGLNSVYPLQSQFHVYKNIPSNKNSILSNITTGSFKDDRGIFWVGTQAGLEAIDPVQNKFSHYAYLDHRLKYATDYDILPVLQNDSSTAWIGTWGEGMQLFDIKKRIFLQSYVFLPGHPESVCSNFIKDFCKDDKGNLWIATWNGGIDRFDIKNNSFEHFNTSNGSPTDYIASIIYANTIWAVSSVGLLKYNEAKNIFELMPVRIDSTDLNNDLISGIAADKNGNVWMGRRSQLIKYDPGENKFQKVLQFQDGLIAGIMVDNKSDLWIATTHGLKQFNLLTSELNTYTLKDGLPVMHYPFDCYLKQCKDGEVLLNSSAGFIHFYPAKISSNATIPSLYFTSVKIKNKDIGRSDFSNINSLDLKYDQNYITINFAALNLINPSLNQYAYQLTGVDKDWIYSDNRNEAIYTNLEPGNYTFKIKASNDAGIWNEKAIELNIQVRYPWWQTWWFYSLCAVVFSIVLYLIYYLRISRLKEVYSMRSHIARDLHDEIGSTLTSINILSKVSKANIEKDKSKAVYMVQKITDQSQQIQQSMSDIVWAINPANDKLENMVVRMREYVAQTLEPQNVNIHFSFDEHQGKETLSMRQRRDFFLVFKEAINNAAKYAECKNIDIKLKRENNHIELIVCDDGIGFNPDNITSSNGLKNMKTRAEALQGNIFIESTMNKGTIITLKVPIY